MGRDVEPYEQTERGERESLFLRPRRQAQQEEGDSSQLIKL